MSSSDVESAHQGRSGRRWRGWRLALPLALLLIQIAVVDGRLVAGHELRPIKVPDTQSYLNQARMSTIDGALMHYRALGYPAAIRLFGFRQLPRIELWLFFLGALALFAGVAAYTRSAWVGLAAATPLLYGQSLSLLGRIQPDFVSCGLVLLAVAALLALAVRPRNMLLWLAVTLFVLAAYHMRPATLFLLGWLPVAGWLLLAVRRRSWRGPAVRLGLGLLAVTWLPYLAFAGWRYSRIGEFGLVGFGGYNLSGLAAALVDEDLVAELEGPHHRMARQMFKMRQRRGWRPYRPGEGSEEWFEQYNDNLWRIGVQAAKQQIVLEEGHLRSTADPPRSLHLRINEHLRGVSREIVRRRFGHYLAWVRDANLHGWRQLAESPWVVWPAVLLAVSASALWLGRRAGLLPAPAAQAGPLPGALAVLALGVSYFAAYVFLISLVSFPFHRYYYGTVLLLPSSLCAVLAAWWLQALGGRAAARDQRSMTAETSGARRGGGEA